MLSTIGCVVAISAVLAASPTLAETRIQSARQHDLIEFLRKDLNPRTSPADEERALTATKLEVAWADLNDDGHDEAIVYLSGRGWCGTGGCSLLILEASGATFRYRGRVSITRPPISLLSTRTQGWRDITAYVVGGGILQGYRAVLPFDGQRYPSNPTAAPAHRLAPETPETIVLSGEVYPFM